MLPVGTCDERHIVRLTRWCKDGGGELSGSLILCRTEAPGREDDSQGCEDEEGAEGPGDPSTVAAASPSTISGEAGASLGGVVLPDGRVRAIVRVDDLVRDDVLGSRSSLGGFAARLVAQRGLVRGAQLIARTRRVRLGARDAEVELPQLVDHRRHELGAPVPKQFGADP